jgi:serine O-acetyltransferase
MLDAVGLHRIAHRLHLSGFRRTARLISRLFRLIYGGHVPAEVEIGAGTELGYGGLGVVIHATARIGRDVLVSPGVVIGGRSELPGAPVIGDRVKIGAGAKVLGPIRIGDDVLIGANAVVITDVEPGSVVVGVPARPLPPRLRILDGAG